jgi:hypothetical protein
MCKPSHIKMYILSYMVWFKKKRGGGGGYWTEMCVLNFLPLLSKTFLILRQTEQDMIQNVKYLLFLFSFNYTWIF